VDPLGLSEELGRVVFGKEEMVKSGRDPELTVSIRVCCELNNLLYSKPLGEFLILRFEFCYCVLLANFLE